jgi:hypothetical protein
MQLNGAAVSGFFPFLYFVMKMLYDPNLDLQETDNEINNV